MASFSSLTFIPIIRKTKKNKTHILISFHLRVLSVFVAAEAKQKCKYHPAKQDKNKQRLPWRRLEMPAHCHDCKQTHKHNQRNGKINVWHSGSRKTWDGGKRPEEVEWNKDGDFHTSSEALSCLCFWCRWKVKTINPWLSQSFMCNQWVKISR